MIRVKVVIWSVGCLFVFLLFGLLNLEVIHGRRYQELGSKNCVKLIPQNGSRGKILDRDGFVIVDSQLAYDFMILPQETLQQDRIIENASKILGKSEKDLRFAFKSNFISSSVPVTIAKNIGIKEAIALDQMKVDFPAIIIQPNPLRHYPYGKLACHILGYVSEIDRWRLTKLEDYGYKTKDIVGFGGIEEKYDYYLRQEEGGTSFEVNHRGKIMRTLGFRPPVDGKDIQLTLNLKIQKIVEEKFSDKKGGVVIMDPYTGEILAMISSPGFRPATFAEKDNSTIAKYFNNLDAPLINRAISGTYPAGSVFKVIVATAALENKKINSNTTFVCQGQTMVGRSEFKCWSTHGPQNLGAAIAHSCNVFFYKTGLLVGPQPLHDYAVKFGLSKPTFIEVPYESAGFIPSPIWRKINKFKNWFDGDTANLSIGQGDVAVTPLQIARMMAVFANNGYLVNAYLVKSIDGRDMLKARRKPEKLNLKQDTIDQIGEGMRRVVADPAGTGGVISGLTVSVAGKSGTAQAPPGQPHAWFSGFFPYKNPKYVICVFIEHGGPGYYSSLLARQIIEQMINEGLI
ncbi:MAG: penicillin-binding protein 2 [Candidatus Omnitrophica bacterium]|nr:penicillin-binding protein 2 [Candidatus Omnitrophota bacterium]